MRPCQSENSYLHFGNLMHTPSGCKQFKTIYFLDWRWK